MKEPHSFQSLRTLYEKLCALDKKIAGYKTLEGELAAQIVDAQASGGCDDPEKIMGLSTLLARQALLPGTLLACMNSFSALHEELRLAAIVARVELERAALAILKPRQEALLLECERVVAPLVKDRQERSRIGEQIFNASEQGAAINRLMVNSSSLGNGTGSQQDAEANFGLFERMNRFEKQFPV
jgi:hypothetical protein